MRLKPQHMRWRSSSTIGGAIGLEYEEASISHGEECPGRCVEAGANANPLPSLQGLRIVHCKA